MKGSVQRNLPPMPLKDVSLRAELRKKDSQPLDTSLNAVAYALERANPPISQKELALALGQSESMVSRKLSATSRERLSVEDLDKFPARFWPAYQQALSDAKGLRRDAVRRVFEAVADLAVAVGE